MVWTVGLIHQIWVEGRIKKPGGQIVWKCALLRLLRVKKIQFGGSRTKAERLEEMMVERNELHYCVDGWCWQLDCYTRYG